MMIQKTYCRSEVSVSVIMPAYNASRTIGDSIESVLKQTHQYFELIIVDDASTDDTIKIANKYREKNSKIRILKNMKNVGVAESRNNGVQAAEYSWIAFLDSDDMWEKTKLEKQLKLISDYPLCSICYTGSAFMDVRGNRYKYTLAVPQRISYQELLKQNLISCSSVLAPKSILLKYPMPSDSLIHEDFATWLQVLRKESFAVGVNEPLLIYRLSVASKSGNKLLAAKMQWRTYRHIGISVHKSAWLFVFYVLKNSKKYILIRIKR